MNGMPWIKLHTSHLDDPRLAVLDAETQLCYYKLLMLGGRLDAGGALIVNGKKLTDDEIAWQLREKNVKKVSQWLKTLKRAGLVLLNGHGWEVSHFMETQGPARDDMRAYWRERQENHRAGQRHVIDMSKTVNESHAPRAESESEKSKIKTRPDQTKTESAGWMVNGFDEVAGPERAIADRALLILTVSGLGKQKSKNILPSLATRYSKNKIISAILAGLASAYADEKVRNKNIVAAMRLENDEVAAQFKNPASWRVLPEDVLRAAGIEDLDEYMREKQPSRKIFRASEQPTINAVPPPADEAARVRAKLKGVSDAKSIR